MNVLFAASYLPPGPPTLSISSFEDDIDDGLTLSLPLPSGNSFDPPENPRSRPVYDSPESFEDIQERYVICCLCQILSNQSVIEFYSCMKVSYFQNKLIFKSKSVIAKSC